MKLALVMLAVVLAPPSSIYVKGHSRAADKVRQNLASFTCFSAGEASVSTATLEVDHLLGRTDRSWIVLVLTDSQHHKLWAGKAEEYPWPFPSPVSRLLRNMGRSTCRGYQSLTAQRIVTPPQHSPAPNNSALKSVAN